MQARNTFTLFDSIKTVIIQTRQTIVRNVNQAMVIAYFRIGKMIIEDEQKGKDRADYAKETLAHLSKALTHEFGKGFSMTNMEYIRSFYNLYRQRIPQSVIEEFETIINDTFRLSWTHYVQLIKIKDDGERSFYEIEAAANNWSVREMQRQYNSALYERLALSKDKESVRQLSAKGQVIEQPADALKSHYVLEFLGLKEDAGYSENQMETAIINKLEHFMMELGKGFLFEGRQRRFTFEGDSFYVDLVFYNRLLRCFVLIDLKIGKLTHQDIGQMQMYVNYYDRMIRSPEEGKTIGIILCKEENRAVVEFTLPEDNRQIFSKEYKAVLPSKEALKKQLQ
jgi:predicted nuclease of restriction endonuclease-like (RecB) superfamily